MSKSTQKKVSTSDRSVTTIEGRSNELTPGDKLELLRFMYLTREFEDTILRLYNQGKIVGGAYSGNGNEATSVGSAFALEQHDYLFPMHRDTGAHFVKGQTPLKMFLQYLGRADSLTHGRDGTGHYSDPTLKIYGNISHLGAMVPVACGAALASKIRNENAVALTYIGDGGSNVGEVHEALAIASAMKLPLILIIENNQFAYSTPVSKQSRAKKLSDRAIGYGIPGITIDGTDVLNIYETCKQAIDRARKGEGPTIIESVAMRMHGHAAHDNSWYVPKELLQEWKDKDPIEQFEKKLTQAKILTATIKSEMRQTIQQEIEASLHIAEASPYPPAEEAALYVYAE